MKCCTKCGETKLLSEFGKHRHCKDGLNPECKECGRKRAKEYSKTPAGIYSKMKGRETFIIEQKSLSLKKSLLYGMKINPRFAFIVIFQKKKQ